MFRVDRIGTPVIHTEDAIGSTAAWTPQAYTNNSANFGGNIINAASSGDFGRAGLRWIGAAPVAIAANARLVLAHQFTIQEPIAGNTVGVELNFAFLGAIPSSALITGFICQTADTPSTLLAQWAAHDFPTFFPSNSVEQPEIDTVYPRHYGYQQRVVIHKPDQADVAGRYMHGVCISPRDGAGWSLPYFYAIGSVRQNQDQDGVNYTDTRR